MFLKRDVPMFGGVIKAGTPVSVVADYFDGHEARLLNVRVGMVEIHGLTMESLSETEVVKPVSRQPDFPF